MSETVLIAILSTLGGSIAGVALWLRAHEVSCRERWEKLLEEHGAIKAQLSALTRVER